MSRPYPLSVLDLAPIVQGSNPTESFKNTVQLAQQADAGSSRGIGWLSTTVWWALLVRRPRC